MRRQAARGILAVLTAITVAAGLAVVLTGSAAPAGAAVAKLPPPSLTWHSPVRADGTGLGNVVAVSCPARSFCAEFDNGGSRATWNGTKWTAAVPVVPPAPGYFVNSGTCATPAFCVAVGSAIWVESGGGLARTQPGTGNAVWLTVTCASTAFCVAGDNGGNVSVYHGHSWSALVNVAADLDPLSGISCVSAKFCLALDSDGSVSTWNGTGWMTSDPQLMPLNAARGVSCSSARFCMAFTKYGDIYMFNGQGWAGPVKTDLGNDFLDISCTSPTFCLALGAYIGDVSEYNGSAWSPAVDVLPYNQASVAYVACSPGATAKSGDCAVIAVLGQANTLRSGRWTGQVNVDVPAKLDAIACPTTSFCAAVGENGEAVTYADAKWKAPVLLISGGYFASVSCPTARFCLAAGAAPSAALRMWRFNGSRWTPFPVPPGRYPAPYSANSVSCVSAAFCVWASPAGAISVWNGKTWTKPVRVDQVKQWLTVSCATTRFCAAGDVAGHVATFNGKTWSGLTTIGIFNGNAPEAVLSLSCTSPRFCAAALGDSSATFNGTTWARAPASDNPSLTAVSCAKGGFCAAVGSVSSGANLSSASAYTLDGHQWSSPTLVFTADGTLDPAVAISCATPKFCIGTDSYGLVTAGT
jgi:hypothetical protein